MPLILITPVENVTIINKMSNQIAQQAAAMPEQQLDTALEQVQPSEVVWTMQVVPGVLAQRHTQPEPARKL